MAFNGWFAGLILSSCLGVFCVFSDHLPLVQQKSNYVRSAVIDSVIHFVIGEIFLVDICYLIQQSKVYLACCCCFGCKLAKSSSQ